MEGEEGRDVVSLGVMKGEEGMDVMLGVMEGEEGRDGKCLGVMCILAQSLLKKMLDHPLKTELVKIGKSIGQSVNNLGSRGSPVIDPVTLETRRQ